MESQSSTLTAKLNLKNLSGYVFRRIAEGEAHWTKPESLLDPIPASLVLARESRAFADFATRYAQRLGHMEWGTLMLLADAGGCEATGDYCLCLSHDPTIIIWPTASLEFLRIGLHLATADDEKCHIHAAELEDAAGLSFCPKMPLCSLEAIVEGERQAEPYTYLPTLFCATRTGLGLITKTADEPDLTDLLSVLAEVDSLTSFLNAHASEIEKASASHLN